MQTCSVCGNPLQPVEIKTVKHLLKYPFARTLRSGYFVYCSNRDCDIYYLRYESEKDDEPAEVFCASDIKERATPLAEGRDQLVCYCFGYTVGEIVDDARSGAGTVPGAIAAEVKAGNCACEVMNPSGH